MSEKENQRTTVPVRVKPKVSERRRAGAAPRMSYGRHGASQTLNSLIGWLVEAGTAEDNIDQYSATLRQRARDL